MLTIEKIYTSWSWQRIYRHVAYWFFWLLLYASVNSTNSQSGFGFWLVVELLIMTIKLPYTYMMIYFWVPKLLIKRKYYQFFLWAFLATLVGGTIVWSIHYYYFVDLIHYSRPAQFFSPPFFYKALDLVYVATFPIILKLQQFYQQQEQQNREIVEQKLNAELELLKNQLQPHFLFNTLNNLYAMILTSDKNATKAVLHLSSMMSYMLYECNGSAIALDKEIEHLKNYIELEKIRYGKRLNISFEFGGDIKSKSIAPLLLFGFVENAFKHGVGKNINDAWIRINCWANNETLDFLVENSLCKNEVDDIETINTNGGIGLQNIKKRLGLIYPERHTLKIEDDETYLVHLKLNLSNQGI
jgi:two-component system, LytTR family, sensor kinase